MLDEFPYLLGDTSASRDAVLGAVQAAWDRTLSRGPVLMVIVGSDRAMMEINTAPRQPLHQRPSRELVVPPLDPAEAASLSGFKGADALDSYLVTGGFPSVVRARMDRSIEDFLTDQLADDGTPFVSTGRLVLDAELGGSDQARSILSVLGEGFRKRAVLANETGIDAANLKRPLDVLIHEKRVIEARRPISTAASRDTRYEISDPFLRFYMRFIDRHRGEIERGRGRVIAPLILRDWSTYRGKAIEPVVRRALNRSIPMRGSGKPPWSVRTGRTTTESRSTSSVPTVETRRRPPSPSWGRSSGASGGRPAKATSRPSGPAPHGSPAWTRPGSRPSPCPRAERMRQPPGSSMPSSTRPTSSLPGPRADRAYA